MRVFKRIFAAFVVLSVLFLACQRVEEKRRLEDESRYGLFQKNESEKHFWQIGGLKGPTSISMVHMMNEHLVSAELGFHIYASVEELKDKIISGELDIAVVPATLAAIVYSKTQGQYQVAAVNTMGLTTIVEKGLDIMELEDLKGVRMAALGKNAVPEFTLRIMFEKVGLNPDRDVTVEWMQTPSEILEWMKKDGNDIAMVPQPFATALVGKVADLRVALDFGDEWNKLKLPGDYIAGVLIVKKEIAENNRERFLDFLKEYQASIDYVKLSEDGPNLVAKYGIIEANIARMAIPSLEIVYMDGEKMKEELSAYLCVLHQLNPDSIGGNLPDDHFYFLPQTKVLP